MPRTFKERPDVIPALAEVFRQYGYNGASLAEISKATGLGKGSLYNFFPGGKAEMLEAVLEEIQDWFQTTIFSRLADANAPLTALDQMFVDVRAYFCSGGRVCLVGALATVDLDDRFAKQVGIYFRDWVAALAKFLERHGAIAPQAMAETVVADIQGAIILSRALNDRGVFNRRIDEISGTIKKAITSK